MTLSIGIVVLQPYRTTLSWNRSISQTTSYCPDLQITCPGILERSSLSFASKSFTDASQISLTSEQSLESQTTKLFYTWLMQTLPGAYHTFSNLCSFLTSTTHSLELLLLTAETIKKALSLLFLSPIQNSSFCSSRSDLDYPVLMFIQNSLQGLCFSALRKQIQSQVAKVTSQAFQSMLCLADGPMLRSWWPLVVLAMKQALFQLFLRSTAKAIRSWEGLKEVESSSAVWQYLLMKGQAMRSSTSSSLPSFRRCTVEYSLSPFHAIFVQYQYPSILSGTPPVRASLLELEIQQYCSVYCFHLLLQSAIEVRSWRMKLSTAAGSLSKWLYSSTRKWLWWRVTCYLGKVFMQLCTEKGRWIGVSGSQRVLLVNLLISIRYNYLFNMVWHGMDVVAACNNLRWLHSFPLDRSASRVHNFIMQLSKTKIRSASQCNYNKLHKKVELDDLRGKSRLSVLSTPKKEPVLRKSLTGKSFSGGCKADLTYNKWFIHPSRRMKPTCSFQEVDRKEETFVYKELYKERYADPDSPFKERISDKIKLLDLLPRTNLRCLEGFQRTQLKKRKRVPQIVEMLLSKVKEGDSRKA